MVNVNNAVGLRPCAGAQVRLRQTPLYNVWQIAYFFVSCLGAGQAEVFVQDEWQRFVPSAGAAPNVMKMAKLLPALLVVGLCLLAVVLAHRADYGGAADAYGVHRVSYYRIDARNGSVRAAIEQAVRKYQNSIQTP